MTAIGRIFAAGAALAGAAATAAFAQSEGAKEYGIGRSEPGQLDLQEMVTATGVMMADLHHLMLWIITAITIFVLALLLIVIVRYNEKANPKPASWTHNTFIEVLWTAAPVVILVIIAIPSVQLLRLQEDFSKVEPDVVIKATGNSWNWTYNYPTEKIEFTASMLGYGATLTDEGRAALEEKGYPASAWKLATDYAMVVPVNKVVLMQVTGSDVIHSWTIPAFGVKADGVPGRINQQWFKAEKEGIYFGQCSELCGKDHAYMPITVKVVSEEAYAEWVACAAANDGDPDGCKTITMKEIMAKNGEAATKVAAATEDAAAR